jgi:hypothetical protein
MEVLLKSDGVLVGRIVENVVLRRASKSRQRLARARALALPLMSQRQTQEQAYVV